MNSAEKRLRAAEQAVEDAQDRLTAARLEVANLTAQAADVDAAIQASIADSVRGGSAVDVDDARSHARTLADRRATAETITSTLEQVVAERRRDVDQVRAADFPELRAALDARAEKLAEKLAEVHARYKAELEPLEEAGETIKAEWVALRNALPRAVTNSLRLEMLGLDVPALEAHVNLAKYDAADPSLPAWLAPLIEQSRALAEKTNPPLPINIPVAP